MPLSAYVPALADWSVDRADCVAPETRREIPAPGRDDSLHAEVQLVIVLIAGFLRAETVRKRIGRDARGRVRVGNLAGYAVIFVGSCILMAVGAEEIDFRSAFEVEARVHRKDFLLAGRIAGDPVQVGISRRIRGIRVRVSGRGQVGRGQARIDRAHVAVTVVAEITGEVEEAAGARSEACVAARVLGATAAVVPVLAIGAGHRAA